MTQTRLSIGVLLDQWLSTVAPDVFTHGDARKGIEVLRNEALMMVERDTLSTALEARVAGGWLQRTNVQGSGKKNLYNVRRRPPTQQQPITTEWARTPARPPRRATKETFLHLVTTLLTVIDTGTHEFRSRGVRAIRLENLLARTVTLTQAQQITLDDVSFEVADAVAFGLFFFGTDGIRDRESVCWRASTDYILQQNRRDLAAFIDTILTTARRSREQARR